MKNTQQIGQICYGLGIAGIGSMQFIFPWFRSVLLPIPPEDTRDLVLLVYLVGLALVVAGLSIAFGSRVKTVSLLLGFGLLLLFVFGHLPNRFLHNPGMLGAWTDAFKLLALSGGALMIARLHPVTNPSGLLRALDKITPYGQYFFGIMLVLFGIDHFLYLDFVKTLVPVWVPGSAVFWTYLSGIALIGGGLAVLLNFKPRYTGLLLAAMLFLWLVLLHIPRALAAPATDNGNEWTSVFQCLAFGGMALVWVYSNNKNTVR